MAAEQVSIGFAQPGDVASWMELVEQVRWDFPGLETEELLAGYQQTVVENMARCTAICAKDGEKVVGVLLFSLEQKTLSCMAVHPAYRQRGIATEMVALMLRQFPAEDEIQVVTYRDGDEKGIAARAFYKKLGFEEAELCNEFNYPEQKFILRQ
ncbi:MAG: GNAT family N-acetyltransferase [Anaerolineaceae bacterium]